MIPVSLHIETSGPRRKAVLKASTVHAAELYPLVRKWPGWRRRRANRHECQFEAPAHPSALLPLTLTRLLEFRWDEINPVALQWVKRTVSRMQAKEKALRHQQPLLRGTTVLPTGREPHLHQWNAIEAAQYLDYRVLLADDMGLGKTSEALWICDSAEVSRILIICPVSVKWNWEREIEATLGKDWVSVVIHGPAKKRAEQFVDVATQLMPYRPHPAVAAVESFNSAVIINYDLLRHLPEQQLMQLREFVSGQALILDESHYVKGRKAERTKIIGNWFCDEKHGARVRLLCSGTPVMNLVDDLYAQLELIRPGTWTSYNDFEKRYLTMGEMNVGTRTVRKIVGTKNVDELNRVVNTVQIRRKKEDAIDLPPKVYTYPELTLDVVTARVYKAMKEFTLLKLDEVVSQHGNVNVFDPRAKSAIDAALRCEQIAQGFVGGVPEVLCERVAKDLASSARSIGGRPREVVFPKAPKLIWVEETIASVIRQGGAPVVFSRFNAPMFWLRERFEAFGVEPHEVEFLHGALTGSEKDAVIERFQGGESRVFLCQVSMAQGFNLTRSQDVIFFGRDWSPAKNSQATDRTHRIGQRGTVNVQIPIVRGTVEVRLHAKLAAKDADAEQALRTTSLEELREML